MACLFVGQIVPLHAQILDTLYPKPNECNIERLNRFKDQGSWLYFTHSSGSTGNPNDWEVTLDLNSFALNRVKPIEGHFCDTYITYLNDSVFAQGCGSADTRHYIKLNNSTAGTQTLSVNEWGAPGFTHEGILERNERPVIIDYNHSDSTWVLSSLTNLLVFDDTISVIPADFSPQLSGGMFYQKKHGWPIYFTTIFTNPLVLSLTTLDSSLSPTDTFSLQLNSLPVSNINSIQGGPANWHLNDMGNYFIFSFYTDGFYHLVKLGKDLSYLGWKISVPFANDNCFFETRYPNSPHIFRMDKFNYFQDNAGDWILYTRGTFGLSNDNITHRLKTKMLKYSSSGNKIWEKCIEPRPPHDPNFTGCSFGNFNGYLGSGLYHGQNLTDTSYIFIGNQTYGPDHDLANIRVLVLDTAGSYNGLNVEETKALESVIRIYPNPAKDLVNIHFEQTTSDYDLKVVDALGRQVYREEILNQSTKLETTHWKPGLYHLVFTSENARQVERLVIE